MMLLYLVLLEETGDRELFEQLYIKYRDKMLRVAMGYLHDQWQAEEATHQSCLKIIENFDNCKKIPCTEIESWIVVIVRNVCKDRFRRSKREVFWADEEGDQESLFNMGWVPGTAREPAAGRETPESQAAYRYLVELIRSMPETLREALEMRFVLEWSVKEIAEALHITESAATARIRRGRELLLKKMEEEGYCHDR